LAESGFSISGHLSELRARLRVVFIVLLVILVLVVFFPSNPSYSFSHLDQYISLGFLAHTLVAAFLQGIVAYVLPPGWNLIAATGIGEGMEIYFVASLLITLVLTMPVIAYETYRFIDPALKEEERKMLYPFVISTTVLFIVGVLFGFFVLSKFLILALGPFFAAGAISRQVDAAAFYYVIFLVVGSTGAAFTAPVFVYALIALRVLDPLFFSRNRVVIWFAIWVVTGLFLTPDGGPLLDLVIFAPIVALVEVAVWLGRRRARGFAPRLNEIRCPYCSNVVKRGNLFCPNCDRSLA
jgi:sec-independent protein translocase protein TatC